MAYSSKLSETEAVPVEPESEGKFSNSSLYVVTTVIPYGFLPDCILP